MTQFATPILVDPQLAKISALCCRYGVRKEEIGTLKTPALLNRQTGRAKPSLQHQSRKFLEAIRTAAFIREARKSKSLANYGAERLQRQAIARNAEIIGEAIKRLPQHDAQTAVRVDDCRQIVAFRNVLVYAHDFVDRQLVCSVIEHPTSTLLRDVETVLD